MQSISIGLTNHCHLILLLTASLINITQQQGNGLIVDQQSQCLTKLLNASVVTCEANLNNRLDLTTKPEEFVTSATNCCFLAEFTHCIDTLTQEKCSRQLEDLYASHNYPITPTIITRCKGYSLYGVTCTLIIHIAYIIAAAVILGLIAIVCCIIGYRRWHMLKMEAKQTRNPFNKY